MKKVLITGITGQTGSYLAEYCLSLGHEVHGLVRRISQQHFENISTILGQITLHHADMTDAGSIQNAIAKVKPNEIYNLAGMSQVRWSYDVPAMTFDVNTLGLLRVIEAVRNLNLDCKIYQASSSEMFGRVMEIPQNEKTPLYPLSPYGVSKAAAYHTAIMYRESYGMKIYNGCLFNHESERRGEEFLSRKVCIAVAEIVNGKRSKLVLGNLDAKRDWGYAKEYAEWIYTIVQHHEPQDFVISTGETHSVREWVELAFKYAGVTDWEQYVCYDQSLLRPSEVDILLGDSKKSKDVLGFEPKIKFSELVKIMTEAELNKFKK